VRIALSFDVELPDSAAAVEAPEPEVLEVAVAEPLALHHFDQVGGSRPVKWWDFDPSDSWARDLRRLPKAALRASERLVSPGVAVFTVLTYAIAASSSFGVSPPSGASTRAIDPALK
jgi:hypothetical protein